MAIKLVKISKLLCFFFILINGGIVFAQSASSESGGIQLMTSSQISGILASVVYAIIGMVLLMIGYKIFDIINPLEFNEELRRNNIALGVTVAGFFIAMAIIVGAAIHG